MQAVDAHADWRAYGAVLDARFRVLLQYRAAALAGIGTQLFFGFVRVMIFDAFFGSSAGPQPMTHAEVISYIWLGQAFLLLGMFGVENETAALIRSGNVACELVRPLDLFTLWYVRSLAGRAAPTVMRAVPQLLLAYAFLGLQAPASVGALGLFLLALAGSLALAAAIGNVFTISLLWTISGEGVSRLGPALVFVFSGMIVPLPFFPEWLQPVVQALPFRGLLDVPFRLYLGHLVGTPAVVALVQQLAWTAVFIVSGRAVLGRGLRRLVVQGG